MELAQLKPIKIAYLYHNEDNSYFTWLHNQLAGLRRQVTIEECGSLLPGENRKDYIEYKLKAAHIIILFISSSFNKEDEYSGKEMEEVIRACFDDGVCIWPIIAKPIDLDTMTYYVYEIFFGESKTIMEHNPLEQAFRFLAESIRREVKRMIAEEWAGSGDRYSHQMEPDKAWEAYGQSLLSMSDCPQALLGRGRILRKSGKREEAIQYFNRVLSYSEKEKQEKQERNKNGISLSRLLAASYYKGLALLELGQFNEAIQSFKNVYQQVNLSTRYVYAHKHICAKAYSGTGDIYRILSKYSQKSCEDYLKHAYNAYCYAEKLLPNQPLHMSKVADICLEIGNQSSRQEPVRAANLYNQALSKYEQALSLSPDYASAHAGRGHALYCLGKIEEALIAYKKACIIDPYLDSAHAGIGQLQLHSKNFQEAFSAFDNALSLDNANPNYYYGKGLALAQLGRHQDALDAYKQAQTHGLESVDILVHKASACLALGDRKRQNGQQADAGDYYREAYNAYRLYSTSIDSTAYLLKSIAFYGMGNAYFGLNDLDNAAQYYRYAINYAPKKADGYIGLGKIHLERGNIHDAIIAFNNAERLYNQAGSGSSIKISDIYIAYGDCYYQSAYKSTGRNFYNDQGKAYKYYKMAIQSDNDVMAYLGLGKTCKALHKNEEAIAALDRALELNPKLQVGYLIKAQCCNELGRPAEVCASYEQAISNGFDSASIRNGQGMALLAMKCYYDAEKAFNYAIEHSQDEASADLANAYYGRGVAQSAMTRCEEALASFEHARQISPSICSQQQGRDALANIISTAEINLYGNPEDASSYKNMGRALSLDERFEEAIHAFTSAISYGDSSADTYARRGDIYYSQQEYQQAFRDFKAAIRKEPGNAHVQEWQEKVDTLPTLPPDSFIKRFMLRFTSFLSHI